jgi:opacity protein-like surface antigen
MRGVLKTLVLSAAVAITLAPVSARADGWVNPWAWINFGSDINDGRGGFGVSAGGMGAGIIGAEGTFGYNPSFFGTSNDFGNNTVLDLMANVIIGIPLGGQRGAGIRPYVTGGLGMIRTQIDGGTLFDVSISDNDPAWNLGAGVMGYFNDHVGLRGDVRYLRNFSNNSLDDINFSGNFDYWRTSFGVVIR